MVHSQFGSPTPQSSSFSFCPRLRAACTGSSNAKLCIFNKRKRHLREDAQRTKTFIAKSPERCRNGKYRFCQHFRIRFQI